MVYSDIQSYCQVQNNNGWNATAWNATDFCVWVFGKLFSNWSFGRLHLMLGYALFQKWKLCTYTCAFFHSNSNLILLNWLTDLHLTVVWGLQGLCAGRKWHWRYQPPGGESSWQGVLQSFKTFYSKHMYSVLHNIIACCI